MRRRQECLCYCNVGDGFVDQEEEGADGRFEVGDGCVFFLAMGEATGGVGEHHDGGHMERHLRGVMERAGGKLGRVAGDFANGFFAELKELRIEGARFDREERSPFDGDIVFSGEAARSFLRFADHGGENVGVEGALIDGDFRGAGNRGDKAGFHLDHAGGADDSGAGLGMAARDFATFERGGRGGEEGIAAQINWRGAGVRGLADEAKHVALQAERAEDDAGGFILRLEDAALFDVKFEIGFGVYFLERGVSVEHGVEVNAVLFEGVDEKRSLLVFERTDFFKIEPARGGSGAEKAVTEARAFFVGPIHEF